ncbi:MAG: hypothetical protein ACFFDK_09215 [Promethearchaeota archaeon]
MNEIHFSKKQKLIATIFYIAISLTIIVIIGGIVYTIADLIMETGKTELFLSLNFGYQIAIIGTLLAGLFFLVVYFYGLSKKGRSLILKNIFRKKLFNDKYRNRIGVKIAAGALMLSIFAIIIGILAAFIYDLFTRPSSGDRLTLSTIFANMSQGQVVLTIGMLMLLIIGLIFFLNYLWYNGYYLILRLIKDLEEED